MKTLDTEESLTILRLCTTCKKQTPHKVHKGDGSRVCLCIPCKQRLALYEETRD